MIFLIDHNLGGHAEILLGNLASQGWLELPMIELFGEQLRQIKYTPLCTYGFLPEFRLYSWFLSSIINFHNVNNGEIIVVRASCSLPIPNLNA
jgi:hypothetical protein